MNQFDTHHVCNNNTYPPSHTKPIDSSLKYSKRPPTIYKTKKKENLNLLEKMASSTPFITLLVSLLSPFFLRLVLAQVPSTCASRLLSLAPCGPFVQGFVQLPAQPCCDSLNQIYNQEANCLCLFLNNTSTLSPAFPINQTLALQLPPLCNIPANSSSCSSSSTAPGGVPSDSSSVAPPPSSSVAPPPSSSNGSQISLGRKNNSWVAASPVAQMDPRPTSFMGLGYGLRSSGSKSETHLIILALAAVLPATLLLI
ncbi:PREDICTED: non-specific lipid-transfer protein-like protein At5g64080 isoform X2 [Camelina sativa]|uniref:Non-specific lipid-transfer protein-like protein At5g64080 isoform X2 n=1 Tax=Camelina sativa TaxID=90675 RepID=A0ABM0SU89_CAMSA|nr:PREDICTED: non-specific lipid-transfer protein-like protein At5g64080 isoform X2 [Camelina sativa]